MASVAAKLSSSTARQLNHREAHGVDAVSAFPEIMVTCINLSARASNKLANPGGGDLALQ